MIKFFSETFIAFNNFAFSCSCVFSHHNVCACGVQKVIVEHDNVEQHSDDIMMVQIVMQWNKLPYSCICQNSSRAFCPCPHFTCCNNIIFHVTTSQDDNLLNIFWTSSMLPHFTYMSMRLESTKTFNSQSLWMIYPWTCLPSSPEPKPTHALII
jgi:hypothetical protein